MYIVSRFGTNLIEIGQKLLKLKSKFLKMFTESPTHRITVSWNDAHDANSIHPTTTLAVCVLVCVCVDITCNVYWVGHRLRHFLSRNYYVYEPRCEKTGLRGFRPCPTQTRL